MNKQQDISPLTPKMAHDIAFTVHKRHYYDCREVDDVLDALLALIDRQEQEKQDIDSRLREYEANIAGIMLECQKLKASAQKEQEEKSGDISEETDGEACGDAMQETQGKSVAEISEEENEETTEE